MARRQVHFFLIVDYEDTEFDPQFMNDNELVATILNRHGGIQHSIIGAFPRTVWRLSHPHTNN